jgi:hypothetical protein
VDKLDGTGDLAAKRLLGGGLVQRVGAAEPGAIPKINAALAPPPRGEGSCQRHDCVAEVLLFKKKKNRSRDPSGKPPRRDTVGLGEGAEYKGPAGDRCLGNATND